MFAWKAGVSVFKIRQTLHISVPFTWNIKEAVQIANKEHCKVLIGGPGAFLMQDYIKQKANSNVKFKESLDPLEPVTTHNPFATFTTRGCISKCSFCAVPRIEGDFREIHNFIPRPIVCDNNFLAASERHFNRAVDRLKPLPIVDFNQSLDCRLFKGARADRIGELKLRQLQFSFDDLKYESKFVDAITLARSKGHSKISCLLLIGFNHTKDESIYMGDLLRKLKVGIYPMRYNPLDTMVRDSYVNKEKGWTNDSLIAFQRCYFTTQVPFAEFRNRVSGIAEEEGFLKL